MKKRIFVTDKRNSTVIYAVVNRCDKPYYNDFLLEQENGSFIILAEELLLPTEKRIKNLKLLRKGCMVRIINHHNKFCGKKFQVYDILGEKVILLTHEGKIQVSAVTLKVIK